MNLGTSSWFRALLGGAAVMVGLGSAGCTTPEGFCEGLVADACETLSTCCKSGAKYDHEACVVQVSAACQGLTDVEKVHSNEEVFDSGAASDCLRVPQSCDDAPLTAEEAFDQTLSCKHVISGFRPPGAACDSDKQCEDAGEYGECWDGIGGNASVCAEVELSSDSSCGFSTETNILTVCGVEQFCDTSTFIPNQSDPPFKRGLEFKGTCKPYLGAGGTCFDNTTNQSTPCKEGLFCDESGGMNGVCAAQKGEGEACQGGDECKATLTCDNDGMGNFVCKKAEQNGPFCFTPPVCGDMDCDFAGGEDPTNCPQDCGPMNQCGDGICDFNGGEPATCPADCCGDGFCDTGEQAVCPADCP
jgi:hypothetical protein